ncbi:MAG: hypothetical protein RL562_3544 [Planctomycetota bacterium]|jgi:hypothetical protein
MKIEYKLEMSEGEYLDTLRMVDRLFGKMASLMGGWRTAPLSAEEPEANAVSEDSDSEASWDPEQEQYWSEYRPQHVVFDDRYGSDRPEGAHVARGETDDRGLETPEEAPLPRVAEVRGVDMDKGRRAFEKLLRLWLTNFGVEDTEQPDRAEAMRVLANSPRSFKVLAYVKAQGGLTHAVNALAPYLTEMDESAYKKLVLDVAGNMTQVASILFPDLSDLYEFKDIFRSGDEEDDDDE